MNEKQLTRAVLAMAASAGVLAHHCRDSRHCDGPPGFPDLLLLGGGGLVLAELKSDDGQTSAGQDLWAWTAHQAGITIPVLRPADLAADRITTLLESTRRTPR